MPTDSEPTTTSEVPPDIRPDAAPVGRGELLVIALFWICFGLVTIATAALDPHGPHRRPEGLNARFIINPIVWACLTTIVFWFSRRVSLDRVFWRRRWWLVLLASMLVANVVDLVSDSLWDAFTPASVQQAEGREPRRFRPGFGNLTWLDDYVVLLATLFAGSARGWVLRDRARRRESRDREARLTAESAHARADSAQLESQLAEARLDALRRQLDPHFLFNTLNAVSALVERDPRGVRRMIGQLSDLLRHSMDTASAPEVPLRQELELLERYVDIMRVRFDDQLEVETKADPRALDALVPNMILQPLVENAIKHGAEQNDDGGRVDVEAVLDGDTLVLRVRDDGPGMAPWSVQAGASVNGSGVGLRNTAARLAHLYGSAQRFSVGPAPDGGTVAEVRIPWHTRANVRQLEAGVPRA